MPGTCCEGRGSGGALPRRGPCRAEDAVVRRCARTPPWLRHAPRLWRERRESAARARITPAIFRHLLRSHSISARKVARALMRPAGPDSLLVIVPAFNEEGAIGGVVRAVRRHAAGSAGAGDRRLLARRHHRRGAQRPAPRCCPCRITWAWADACRRATSWPSSWASSTSSAWMATASTTRATSRAFSTRLKSSGCEMVIGSRDSNGDGGYAPGLRALAGHPLLPRWCCGPFWASRCTIPPPVSWA